jgi:hypothetical protein
MKKRYDDGGYIPKSIFNQEGTDIADVGDATTATSASEEEPKAKKKPKATRAARPASVETRKDDYGNEGRSAAKPRSKLDPYGVIEGAADKAKGAASSIGDTLSSPFRAIREAGNRGNPDAPKKMAKGGSASSRADGIAQRGKTKGTMVMCGGGMSKR